MAGIILDLVDALHFHRCVKNLAHARGKVCATGGACEDPTLHMTFDERALVLRSEHPQHQNLFALGTSRTFGESDGVANINRHNDSLSFDRARRESKSRLEKSCGEKTSGESTREQVEGQLPKKGATVDSEENAAFKYKNATDHTGCKGSVFICGDS